MNRKYVKKDYEYQILTNDGETIGLPFGSLLAAEIKLLEIKDDENKLKELCPDTDITTIKYLTIDIIDTGKINYNDIYKPNVVVRNNKLGIKYVLCPEVYGYDTKTLKDSLDLNNAEILMDIHLGLSNIPINSEIIKHIDMGCNSNEYNHGLAVYRLNRDTFTWNLHLSEYRIKEIKDLGYEITINGVNDES